MNKSNKYFEYKKAFCMNDKVLLCINCILEENHKTHELDSILNAKNAEMRIIEKHLIKVEQVKQKIIHNINNIFETNTYLKKLTEKSIVGITHFYNNVRKILNEREEKQKNKIKEQLDKEETSLNIQQKSLKSILQKISESSGQFKDLSNQSPISFLKQSNKRKQLIHDTTIEDTQLNINLSVPAKFDFNKEKEVSSLVKIINQYIKNEQSKQNQSQNNNGHHANQKALKLSPSRLKQTNAQQAATTNQATGGVVTQVSTSTKQAKLTPQQTKKESKSSKSKHHHQSNERDSQGQVQPTHTNKRGQHGDTSSHSSKVKKSFNVLEELKSEEMLEEKQANLAQANAAKGSVFNKSLKREMRNQMKEKLTSEREQGRSQSREEQNYISQGVSNNKKDTKKESNDSKNKRSPISMISLVNNQNQTPTVTSSLNQPPKNTGTIHLAGTSNLTSRGNLQTTSNTGTSSLQNSKNIQSPQGTSSSGSKIQSKTSPKQDPSKKQDQKQTVNIDFAALQKNPQEFIGKNTKIQNQYNANESCEMSEIACNTSEKNEEHRDFIANNSFKGEINTFLLEQSQPKINIPPNLQQMAPVKQQSVDTHLSAYNSSNSQVTKINTFMSDPNDIYSNKWDFSSVQNSNQFIYVFGGFTENQQYTIDRFDLARNIWEQFDIMPTNRSKFCSALLTNGNILMIGGKQDNLRVSTIDEYNPRFKTFQKASLQLSSPRSGFGIVCKNDMIYIVGGNDGYTILDTMEMYDFVIKQVRPFPRMLEKRDELAVTQGLDGKIYAIGGFGGDLNTCLSSAERYDPVYQRWEKIAPLNRPRRALSAVTLPDGIYAIGGFDGNNYINSVEKYDESSNRWIYVSNMRYSRCTSSALVSQNNSHIYVFGGFDNGPLDSVERYNVLNGSWETLQPMPNKRFMHCCELIQK